MINSDFSLFYRWARWGRRVYSLYIRVHPPALASGSAGTQVFRVLKKSKTCRVGHRADFYQAAIFSFASNPQLSALSLQLWALNYISHPTFLFSHILSFLSALCFNFPLSQFRIPNSPFHGLPASQLLSFSLQLFSSNPCLSTSVSVCLWLILLSALSSFLFISVFIRVNPCPNEILVVLRFHHARYCQKKAILNSTSMAFYIKFF